MPGRKIPLISEEIYHVFNRGIDRRTTFATKWDYKRAIQTLNFYRFSNLPISLSKYLRLETDKQRKILDLLTQDKKLVEIISFCLMPNHFHLLIKQIQENGISKFLGNFQNSYTRYFNIKNKRDGSLFLDQFKAVRIETDEQLLHVSRYIHLNPYTGYLVKKFDDLINYQWSSLKDYLQDQSSLVNTDIILGFFKQRLHYKSFVLDQADYQRRLKEIEHLILE